MQPELIVRAPVNCTEQRSTGRKLSNATFLAAARHRLGLAMPLMAAAPACDCGHEDAASPDHAHVCNATKGLRTSRHDQQDERLAASVAARGMFVVQGADVSDSCCTRGGECGGPATV